MKKISILMVLLCTACAYSRTLYTDENGASVREAFCGSALLTIGDCYKKAKEDCPSGFDVKDRISSEWAASRNLVYTCKNANYQMRKNQNTNTQYYRYR
jgi:hypothetical protein